jgi:serine/threonine protein kinase
MVGKRYRILETIGKGAFGTVYRAEVLGAGDFKKQVALKVLDYKGDAPDEIALRFRDEARILGLIRHRAVVAVDSLAELETGWAVVMEYVDGVDLTSVIKYGLPPARVVIAIVEEVSSALHSAWSTVNEKTGESLRLVHRDIKPANIRITAQGEVKVLDFGVARAEFETREAHTQAMRFGSLRYMAPESFDGIEGHPTDVFALGVVMAELLAGKRLEEPPKNPERYDAFVEMVREAAKARLAPDLPSDHLGRVLGLVCGMIAFEPEERPSARRIERTCRELGGSLPGPTLRDWAEDYIPALVEKMAIRKAQKRPADSPSSSVLIEKSTGEPRLAGSLPPSSEVPAHADITDTRATAVVTAAGGAMFGAGAMALIFAVVAIVGAFWFVTEGPGKETFAPIINPGAVGAADETLHGKATRGQVGAGTADELAGDEDGDGIVSEPEKRLLLIARSGDYDGDGTVTEAEKRELVIITSGDADGDGSLSDEEQRDFVIITSGDMDNDGTVSADEKRLLLIARAGDADGDGEVTDDEQREFVLATDGDTDGDGDTSIDELRVLLIAKGGGTAETPESGSGKTIRVTRPAPAAPAPVGVAPPPAPTVPPIAVTGDAIRVSFVSGAGTFGQSDAPPGTYRIMALFPGQADTVQAGTVTVYEGATRKVNCTAMMLKCSAK